MKRKNLLLGAAAAALLIGQIPAAEAKDWYVGFEGGLSLVDDINGVRTVGSYGPTDIEVSLNGGWALMATVGFWVAPQWRIEGEVGYRHNRHDVEPSSRYGTLEELSLMLNAGYDIDLGDKWKAVLGAGIGADQAMFQDGVINDRDWRFAYQGLVGLRYELSDSVTVQLNYRYLRVSGPHFEGINVSSSSHLDTYDLDDISKHSFTIGFVFPFGPGAPPPAEPPKRPPPPPTPSDFTITFDKKCNLTAEANEILTEAGATAKQSGSSTVKLVSTGGSLGDEDTSVCRYNAAKANLVAKGIPESAIRRSGPAELRIELK